MKNCPNCGRPFDGHMHAGDPCEWCEAGTDGMADPGRATRNIARVLEELRGEIDAERISYGGIAQLQGLAAWIDPSDVQLLEWAGVPEQGPRYIVIENTPGYLPEDDDPLITEDYAAAVAYLNERAASYEDDADANYEVTYGCASSGNYAAVMVKDLDREHDLGRLIAIELYEGDDA